MSRKQTAESFWSRVNIGSNDICWEWGGSRNSSGYGTVAWWGQIFTAHRVAAWLSGMVESPKAPISARAKTFVLHSCDNRCCCNPNHLFLGSYSDNQLDAYKKKRRCQPRGVRHVNAKLTELQVRTIRYRYNAGECQVPLAIEYGVSQRCISLIVRGETYK